MEFEELSIQWAATMRVLADKPEETVDVVFFHNRSYGDAAGLAEIAHTMTYLHQPVPALYISVTNNEGERYGSDTPFEANPGMTKYIKDLQEIGVHRSRIFVPQTQAYHVRQENTAFIAQAREFGWQTGVILTQPHQALRTMLGAVQELNQTEYPMRLYAVTPESVNWEEIVYGSQGMEEKPRSQHIGDEIDRIALYQSTGELASFDDLHDYYQRRGSLRLH